MAMTWKHRIARAKKTGEFTADDRNRASDWGRCAVGEQSQRFVKREKPVVIFDREVLGAQGDTSDDALLELGSQFDQAVQADEVVKAERLYEKIVKRSECLVDLSKQADRVIKDRAVIEKKMMRC